MCSHLAETTSDKLLAGLLDVRHRLEYGLLRGLVALVRAMPLDTAVRVSAAAWRRAAPVLSPKRHRRALENIGIAMPELPEERRREIVLAHWANLGRVMAETMQIDRILADPTRIEIVSPSFRRYKNKLGPIVGCSLHMGNWELAIWPLVVAGANPAAVYRTVKNPYVDQYLRDQRRTLYPGGLFGKGKVEGSQEEGQRTARFIMDYVRKGGRLGLVCDLYDKFGLPVPFFGRDARSVAIAGMIARRTGARIWLSRCIRIDESSRFRIELVELKVPRSDNLSDDVRVATAGMQRQFEAWVRELPEQWMWSNRRWN